MAEFPHGGGGPETDPIAGPKLTAEEVRAKAAEEGKQPVDSDLTALAALSSTAFGRSFIELADAAAARTKLGLGTAATAASSSFDAAGAAAAAQAASQPLDSDLTALAALTSTSFGRTFIELAGAPAARTKLGLGTAAVEPAGAFDASGAAAAAQAASQPLDGDLTAIAALVTTEFGRAFLALANAAAGRTALGLGTAAVEAATAFDAAGAAAAAQAAAIAASQPLDSDLTAIAALATTGTGRSLLAAADAAALRTIIETNSMSQFENYLRAGLPEKFWWGLSLPQTSFGVLVAPEKEARYTRYTPHRDIICRGLSFVTNVAATTNDEIAIVMKAANGTTTLAGSGGVAGKVNGASLGRIDVDFTEDVKLEKDVVYHPGFQYGTKGGTAATLMTYNTGGFAVAGTLFDPASAPVAEHRALAANAPTFPFATSPTLVGIGAAYLLIVRER